MEKIGLIAGNRKFPILFAQAARKRNHSVVAVAVKGDTSTRLRLFVDKIYWVGLNEFWKLAEIFKDEGVKKVVMAGQISPRRLFSKEVRKDKDLKKLLDSIRDNKADTIFGAIAQKLKDTGFELMDSTTFMEEYMPKRSVLTKREPDFLEWEDIYFGFGLAKTIGYFDIGQTVAVKGKAVVAVEALEGTDNLIRRAAKIAGSGVVIIKASKPKQDLRFDIPVIGLNTIKNIVKSGCSCLAFEAEKTLFIDKEAAVRLADRKGIAIAAA